ncbi:MAG: glycosyltransferase family 39 protein, partial [Lewinellaceae bacterium]|nr:glycosyltransferase family 39 protein [Lewinellaceae bacterium]
PYDYRLWCCNHIWLNKPPLALWLMAGSMKIFGISIAALRLPSMLFAVLGILLTFRLGALLFSKKTGLIAAFLLRSMGN